MTDEKASRRRFLRTGAAVGVLGVAGCIGDDADPEDVDVGDNESDQGDAGDGDGGGGDGDDGDGGDGGDAEYEVQVGTSAGGTFDVGLAFEQAVSEHSDTVAYSTIESPGYVGTTYRLSQGNLDAGIVDNNTLDKAINGNDMFEDDPVDIIPWQGFQLFPYSGYLMARDDTDIETFDDLAGATVYPAEPGYSNRATALDVWSQEPTRDVYEQMEIVDMDVADAPGAMEEGTIDASIAYGTPGVGNTGWVVEYDARVDVHYVQHTDELVESIEMFPGAGLSRFDNAQEEFKWQQDIGTDEIVTWDLEVTFCLHPETEDEAAHELARVAGEHGDTIKEAEPRFTPSNPEELAATTMADYPVHPGVAEYFQDEEVWEDDWVVGDRDQIGEYTG